jgi:hypothetical protein
MNGAERLRRLDDGAGNALFAHVVGVTGSFSHSGSNYTLEDVFLYSGLSPLKKIHRAALFEPGQIARCDIELRRWLGWNGFGKVKAGK